MINKILTFLFGNRANIFNKKGEVVHKLPDDHWKNWNQRYSSEKNNDWRKHKGNEA